MEGWFGKYQGLRQETLAEKKRIEKLGNELMACGDGYSADEWCNTIWRMCAMLLILVEKKDRKGFLENILFEAEYMEKLAGNGRSN